MIENLPKKPLAFILYFTKEYKPILFLLWIFAFARVFIHNTLMLYTLKLIVDSFEKYQGSQLLNRILLLSILFILEFALEIFINSSVPALNAYSNGKAERNMRKSIFSYISKHSYDYFINTFSGNLTNKINNVTNTCGDTVLLILDDASSTALNLIVYIVIFYMFSPILGSTMFVWFLIVTIIAFLLFKKLKQKSHKIAESKSIFSGTLVDILTNISSVKGNAKEKYEFLNIKKDSDNVFIKFKEYAFLKAISVGIINSVSILFITAIIIISIYLKGENLITTGSFVFTVSVIITSLWKIYGLTESLLKINDNLGTISEGLEKLLTPHKIKNKEKAKDLKVFAGKIEIKNLSFEYKLKKEVL